MVCTWLSQTLACEPTAVVSGHVQNFVEMWFQWKEIQKTWVFFAYTSRNFAVPKPLFIQATRNSSINSPHRNYMETISTVLRSVQRRRRTDDPLQWRHNERNGVSNYRRLDCLRNRLFRRRPMKTSELRVTVLCEVNSQVTDGLPAQSQQEMKPS